MFMTSIMLYTQVLGGMAGALIVEDEPTADPALLAMDDVVAVVQYLCLDTNPISYMESVLPNNGSSTLPLGLHNPHNITRNLVVVCIQPSHIQSCVVRYIAPPTVLRLSFICGTHFFWGQLLSILNSRR